MTVADIKDYIDEQINKAFAQNIAIDTAEILKKALIDTKYMLDQLDEWETNLHSSEIYEKCKEAISDRLVDGEIKARSKTVIKMTPKEWLEEIIYHYGNRNIISNPIHLCCDLFILLDKLQTIEDDCIIVSEVTQNGNENE